MHNFAGMVRLGGGSLLLEGVVLDERRFLDLFRDLSLTHMAERMRLDLICDTCVLLVLAYIMMCEINRSLLESRTSCRYDISIMVIFPNTILLGPIRRRSGLLERRLRSRLNS